MKKYLYDYNRAYFLEKSIKEGKKYYFKSDKQYIEVSEEVFKLCKSSYNKIRYHYKTKVDRSIKILTYLLFLSLTKKLKLILYVKF